MEMSTTEKLGTEPRYILGDAAILAGTTTQTLKRWVTGSKATKHRASQPAVIKLDSVLAANKTIYLSFFNVVEAAFLAAYRNMDIPMQRVRPALDFVISETHQPRPLLGENFKKVGKDLLIQYVSDSGDKKLLNASKYGQIEWPEAVEEYFKSIEYDKHGPILMWLSPERKIVGIDPKYAFGRPIIVRNGLRTDAIGSRFAAGEPMEEIAEDFSIPVTEVEEAIRWENESLRRAA